MNPIVIFDVDGVLGDGSVAPKCLHAPGLLMLTSGLITLGYELHAWSAGGDTHAHDVVKHGGMSRMFVRYHDKAPYPMHEADALAILGARPVLQIDDDISERVSDWAFLHADGWYP